MKFLLLLLLSASAFGQSIQDRVKTFEKPKDYKVEYDKFQKETTVSFDAILPSTKKGMHGLPVTAFIWISDIGDVSYAFYFRPVGRHLFNRDRLTFLIDGYTSPGGETRIDYSSMIPVPKSLIDRIVTAKEVELQLSLFEVKLDDKTLKKLRNLASLAN